MNYRIETTQEKFVTWLASHVKYMLSETMTIEVHDFVITLSTPEIPIIGFTLGEEEGRQLKEARMFGKISLRESGKYLLVSISPSLGKLEKSAYSSDIMMPSDEQRLQSAERRLYKIYKAIEQEFSIRGHGDSEQVIGLTPLESAIIKVYSDALSGESFKRVTDQEMARRLHKRGISKDGEAYTASYIGKVRRNLQRELKIDVGKLLH